MTPSMEKVALEIAKVAFVKFNDRHEAASYIVHEFDEKYGWEIIHFISDYVLENTGIALSETFLLTFIPKKERLLQLYWKGWDKII